MITDDDQWTRISREYAEKREMVVEAVELLVTAGFQRFTLRMVWDLCKDVPLPWHERPTFNLVERTLTEMCDARFLRRIQGDRPTSPRWYECTARVEEAEA